MGLPADFRDRSEILPDGYTIPIPTTRTSTLPPASRIHSEDVQRPVPIERPLWIDGDRVKSWAALLNDIGLIEKPDATAEEDPDPVPSQSTFFAKSEIGTHLVHAGTAETSVITYDQVEKANTQLDTLGLKSCVIATFGRFTTDARDLANNLRRSKELEIVDGEAISERLGSGGFFAGCRTLFSGFEGTVTFTPLIVRAGVAVLVIDAVQRHWFSLVDVNGAICPEHDGLVGIVREKLPVLRSLSYKGSDGVHAVTVKQAEPPVFDKQQYLIRCLTLFDTAQYAGLAAVGIRLPVESLRSIYVPTSANVEQQQAAVQATERAIEELAETLGLDERQRDQLARQMKEKYGSRKTAEVGAASKLYQKYSNMVVLGDPGSGKSCFVRTEMMDYCEPGDGGNAAWYQGHVPVFLPLAEYSYSGDVRVSLLDQCTRHAQYQGLALDRQQLDTLLSRGEVAFFLDGLDEVSSLGGRERVLSELTELVETYAVVGNRFVLTSRPAAVRDAALPEALARVSLSGLTDDEIEALVHRLFEARYPSDRSEGKVDRQIISDILRDCAETPGIRRLARNPLLLTLLVLVYENSGAIAARRHLIYSQAIKTLVSVRHREIQRPKVSESDLRVSLGKLAVAMFSGEESVLPTRGNVLRIVEEVTGDVGEETDFVQEVAETTGLLLVHPRTEIKDNDLVSFMHYSFLEYYTAIGFLDRSHGVRNVAQLALNPRWREVVTLMFGILGEQGDITKDLEVLTDGHEVTDSITVNRLLLAFDCALECHVPPERTQSYLAEATKRVLSEGSGLFVSEVREELGERVGLLLEATGSRHFRKLILDGISAPDGQVVAAFVDFAVDVGAPCNQDEEVGRAISLAFERNDRNVNLAIINSLRSMPAWRSPANLEVVGRILRRGGIVERTAAVQLLDEEPALIQSFGEELRELLYGENQMLAAGAGAAIIRGGLFQRAEYTDLGMFDRALRLVVASDAPRRSLAGVVKMPWETVEDWIFAADRNVRERGFRSLVAVEGDAARVHDVLFRSLKTESDSVVVTTILNALAAYRGAIQAASLAETDQVCRLTKSEHGNVRRAAARVLRSFPTMEVVTNALIEQYQLVEGKFTDETREVVRAIAGHAVRDKACRALLNDEIRRLLKGGPPRWTERNVSMVTELLFAGDQFGMEMKESDAERLITVARDFRNPPEVRRLSMRLYGQTCATNVRSIRALTGEFGASDGNRRLSAYRAGRRLLQRCRARFESVQLVVEALEEAKDALVRSWTREVSAAGERNDGTALREIRNFLVDIETTLSAYQEFAERMTAESFVRDNEEPVQ